MIPEDLFKHMKCCLNTDNHVVNEPIMVKCGGNACKSCIEDSINLNLKCYYCNDYHLKNDMLKMPSNDIIQRLVEKKYLNELVKSLKEKLCKTAEELEVSSVEKEIDMKIELIENEIDTKIGSLVRELYKIRDSFKNDLFEMKKRLQESIMDESLNNVRLAIQTISNEHSSYTNFIKHQNLLRECQMKLNNFKDELKQIEFHPNEALINKTLIGNLVELNFNYFNPKSSLELDIQNIGEVGRFTYMKSKQMFILVDNKSDLLRFITADKKESFLFSHDKIKAPVALCIDQHENLYIGQNRPSNILVFNKSLEFQHGFDIHVRVSEITDLVFDPLDSKSQLYVADCKLNRISVFENQSGLFIKSIPIQAPKEIIFSGEMMLVLSNDSILVSNKHNLRILKEIRLEAGCTLIKGLHFDTRHANIVTTAEYEGQRVLTVVDNNGNIILQKELPDLKNEVNYLDFIEGKLVSCSDKKLNIIEFF